ncbi:MAG: hypothetical protein FWE34_03455 [Defluviitaleaceae bacterium]|nr:hypothetical protein [Defluviitaleaceae bacterium]
MVFPVAEMVFKVGAKGVGSQEADMTIVKEMETLTIAVDNGIEEWTPLNAKGWKNRMVTTKGLTITLSGKRHFGDRGNDYVYTFPLKNAPIYDTISSWHTTLSLRSEQLNIIWRVIPQDKLQKLLLYQQTR